MRTGRIRPPLAPEGRGRLGEGRLRPRGDDDRRSPPDYRSTVERDGIPRADTTIEKLASLKPVFDKVTAPSPPATASPLTDGAVCALVMEEQTAQRLGFEPMAYLRSWGFSAVDPNWQLLIGPAFATPIALDRAGMSLDDIDVIDVHEAFAAQVLAVKRAFASDDVRQGAPRPGRRSARSPTTSSTCTAARSVSATPSPPPEHASSSP